MRSWLSLPVILAFTFLTLAKGALLPAGEAKGQDGDPPGRTTVAHEVQATATDDWYCPARDGAHTFTSKDNLPPPLKFKWYWEAPEGRVYQVVSSGGKVFVKGRSGGRGGVHNYVLNIETGKQEAKDPDGLTPNDVCEGWPGGTYGGKIYQADDGGWPYIVPDTWGPLQIDPDQKVVIIMDTRRGDGPFPGIYCAPLGRSLGAMMKSVNWRVTYDKIKMKDFSKYCEGDTAIGPGIVYAIIKWKKVKDAPQLKSGLLGYDLATGKERWHVTGKFVNISAGKDFCVAVNDKNVMAGYSAKDGERLWKTRLKAPLMCHPMVVGRRIRVYDGSGALVSYKLSEEDGKYSIKRSGQRKLGRYRGPRTKGRQNHVFCYSADGTLYVANGVAVSGRKKGSKTWKWRMPKKLVGKIGALGQPIIARGKLLAVGGGGVICFDKVGRTELAGGEAGK